jgi:broad specificity phosphatase PhoE
MSTILLIRHGETFSNVGLPTSCPETIPLTELGKEQAECIAKYLKSQFFLDLIITSSYQRTKQTAAPTQLFFPSVPEEEWPVKEFTFLASVHGENSTIDDRRPLVEAYWKDCNLSRIDGPGSQSFEQFIESARRVIMRLKCAKYNTIAMFSHRQFICALLWLSERDPVNLSQETMREFRDFLNANALADGAIVHIQFDNSDERWQCKIITSHLEKSGEPEPVRV